MMYQKFAEMKRHTCETGYTLMEVMIAIAIFSVGFLAVGSMQIMAMKTGINSRSQTTVLSAAVTACAITDGSTARSACRSSVILRWFMNYYSQIERSVL